MNAQVARLRQLRRLERVRAIAKQTAAAEAAQAEGTLAQLLHLHERTLRLVDEYAVRPGSSNGMAMREQANFLRHLTGLSASTAQDSDKARNQADVRQTALAAAERRRASVEEHAGKQRANLARRAENAPYGARRSNWHEN